MIVIIIMIINDHGSCTSPSMIEGNGDCNVGGENFSSGEEHEQNDETSHSDIRLAPVEYSNGNIQNIWNIQKF